MKKWQILHQKTEDRRRKTEEIIKILLENRGFKTKKEIEEFLNPNLSHVTSYVSLNKSQLTKAVNRIKKAIKNKESIIVYSDYDADGVCGAAILWETLNRAGAKAMPYIPHRVEEGYGLSKKGIDFVKKEYGADLIITVDHGISAAEKVEYGKRLGIDIIVTDHHVAPKNLPKACAIVHTTSLCGAGVAWFLARQLAPLQGDTLLDLVAMATIADMVPLTGANRILVKSGLTELNQTKRLGLKALIKEAGLEKGKIGVYEVSHVLAPRLNAMGRMEHAMDSLRLLCTKDEDRARELARHLDQTNRSRQQLTEETLQHAKASSQLSQQLTGKLLFVYHQSYEQGVIGLVAGKLVEEFYRPAIVVSYGEVFCKASARSINGFNIIETIRKAQDLLVDAGGHPMAAGFTVETKNLDILQKRLTEIAEKELDEEKLTRVLKIDCELDLEDLSLELYEKLEQFKPYGLGNPEPVFATRGVIVQDAKRVGVDGQHLKLVLKAPHELTRIGTRINTNTFSAVAFGMGDLFSKLSPDQRIDIAYTLSVDEWNGNKRLELKIKDIKIP